MSALTLETPQAVTLSKGKVTMSSLQVFEQFEIRFVEHPEGKYGFGMVADDLAEVLEIRNAHQLSCEDDYKGSDNITTLGGTQSMTVIWEPGVYQVLSTSRKPKAKPFQKWLFEEVLPTIRQTGQYKVSKKVEPPQRQLPPIRDSIDFINAAQILQGLSDPLMKSILGQRLMEEATDTNRLLAGTAAPAKTLVIASVRASQLGYTEKQIGTGSNLGKFILRQGIKPVGKAPHGKYSVNVYELTDELDRAIHAYFS